MARRGILTTHTIAQSLQQLLTIAGITHENGYIKDLDQSIVDFFPDYEKNLKDKEKITIKHLLTMTSGFNCGYEPAEKELYEMYESSDWVDFALNLEMVKKPGTEFSYCSSGMHILSSIIKRTTGKNALENARQYLFAPLGIEKAEWPTDPHGINRGGGELRLYPHDMAKIGYLYLNNGKWDGQQTLSANWVKNATKKQVSPPDSQEGYGYGWWTFPKEYEGMYAARGLGGQEIIVLPKYNLVVVLTAGGVDIGDLSPFLIESIKSNTSIPDNPAANKRLIEKIKLSANKPSPTKANKMPFPEIAQQISGKIYKLTSNRLGLKTLSLSFDSEQNAYFIVSRLDKTFKMKIGLDGNYIISEDGPADFPPALKGFWSIKNQFVLYYNEVGGIRNFKFEMNFEGSHVNIMINDPSGHFNGIISGDLELQSKR